MIYVQGVAAWVVFVFIPFAWIGHGDATGRWTGNYKRSKDEWS